jgi:competence ComEA-like helix-hairpin-helix protein
MIVSEFGMRVSKAISRALRFFISSLIPQSATPVPQSIRYCSLGQQRVLVVLTLIILTIFYFRLFYSPLPSPPKTSPREIVVEVLGEVRYPGIQIDHHFPTLKEAIEKAGGLKDAASLDMNSSLETLETGTLVTVAKDSAEGLKVTLGSMGAHKLLVFSIPLDLNHATAEDLCLIPGIGDSLAQEIVTYRERRKGFRLVEDLKNVKGIGEKKFNDLKTFLRVNHSEF